MKRCSTKGIAIRSLVLLLCSGCASTSFAFDITIAIPTQKDERQPNEEEDKMWSGNPLDDTARTIEQEMMACGLFREVIPVSNPDQEKTLMQRSDIRIFLRPVIRDLPWEIPDREDQEDTSLLPGIFTGDIGELAYETGSTDCYGNAKIRMHPEDRATSRIILDKAYASRVKDKIMRLNIDSSDTRAKIIWKAFKQAMEQFKVNLRSVVNTLERKR